MMPFITLPPSKNVYRPPASATYVSDYALLRISLRDNGNLRDTAFRSLAALQSCAMWRLNNFRFYLFASAPFTPFGTVCVQTWLYCLRYVKHHTAVKETAAEPA